MANISWEFDLDITPEEAEEFLGLEDRGKVQKIVDSTFVHYMRQKMPWKTGMMALQSVEYINTPGEITINSPYAHYMNEGILYVNPKKGRSGFPVYQKFGGKIPKYGSPILTNFVGYKGKRVPTTRLLNYVGGPTRGSHFIERTIAENKNDILEAAKKGVKNQ